jgi:hypothetical protein
LASALAARVSNNSALALAAWTGLLDCKKTLLHPDLSLAVTGLTSFRR